MTVQSMKSLANQHCSLRTHNQYWAVSKFEGFFYWYGYCYFLQHTNGKTPSHSKTADLASPRFKSEGGGVVKWHGSECCLFLHEGATDKPGNNTYPLTGSKWIFIWVSDSERLVSHWVGDFCFGYSYVSCHSNVQYAM